MKKIFFLSITIIVLILGFAIPAEKSEAGDPEIIWGQENLLWEGWQWRGHNPKIEKEIDVAESGHYKITFTQTQLGDSGPNEINSASSAEGVCYPQDNEIAKATVIVGGKEYSYIFPDGQNADGNVQIHSFIIQAVARSKIKVISEWAGDPNGDLPPDCIYNGSYWMKIVSQEGEPAPTATPPASETPTTTPTKPPPGVTVTPTEPPPPGVTVTPTKPPPTIIPTPTETPKPMCEAFLGLNLEDNEKGFTEPGLVFTSAVGQIRTWDPVDKEWKNRGPQWEITIADIIAGKMWWSHEKESPEVRRVLLPNGLATLYFWYTHGGVTEQLYIRNSSDGIGESVGIGCGDELAVEIMTGEMFRRNVEFPTVNTKCETTRLAEQRGGIIDGILVDVADNDNCPKPKPVNDYQTAPEAKPYPLLDSKTSSSAFLNN